MLWNEELVELLQHLVQKARLVHKAERGMTLQSVDLVYELHTRHATMMFGMSQEKLAKAIGLTPDTYAKRVRMGRLFQNFPEAREMYIRGETEVSSLAVIAGKLTEANSAVLFEGIRGKSRREVEAFASRVNANGDVSPQKGHHDINVRLHEDQYALLERLREVLSHNGDIPTMAEIVERAFEDCLDKRDPMRKAERAQARAEKNRAGADSERSSVPAPGRTESVPLTQQPAAETHERKPIPSASKNAVFLRDGGRCTFVHGDGSRCDSRSYLQIDHIEMVCRGGNNELSNLRLLCAIHNRWEAERNLGTWFREKQKDWSA